MTYATITPSRGGERKPLFEFCIQQLKKMNNGESPTNAYIMNDPPKNGEADLIPRIRQGIELAKRDGFTHVYITEDDDFYCADYLQRPLDFDFFGYSNTLYYNLRNRTYQNFTHPKRSSLFTTAFRISALQKFKWPLDNTVFLDLAIWKFATQNRFKVNLLRNNPCTGIKHQIGKCGGNGHKKTFRNVDSDLCFLRSRVDESAFEFYKDLMLTL
jgi:hypothetical protein